MQTEIEKKKAALMESLELTKSGFAGVMEIDGVIRKVDRRHYPHAIPVPENKMLGVPPPRTVEVLDCPDCYGGHFRPCQMCGDSGKVVNIPNVRDEKSR